MKLASRRRIWVGCRNGTSVAAIDTVIAAAKTGEHLVSDGAHVRRQIVDAQSIAYQGGKVPTPGSSLGKLGHIRGEQVHRHAADEGTTASSDDDLGHGLALGCTGRAQKSIGVADGNNRNPAWTGGGPGGAVTHGFALVDCAHLDDPR